MRREIVGIITKVRYLFISRQVDQSLLKALYGQYNPDVRDLDLFVARALSLFPRLNCGLATLYIKKVLNEGGIVKGLYKGENHTFLLLNSIDVVDITADQYGGPPIYFGPITYPWEILIP